jgi:hypothetical protein
VGHLVMPVHCIGPLSRKAQRSRLTVTGGRAHATRGWANTSDRRGLGRRPPRLSGSHQK